VRGSCGGAGAAQELPDFELDELAVSFLLLDEPESLVDEDDESDDFESDDFDSEPEESLPLAFAPDFDDRLSVL
jgi:hypothetical protein